MGEIFLAGKEAQEGTAVLGIVVADGSAEHGVAGFEGVEDRAQCRLALDFELHLAVDLGEGAEMLREKDSDHDNVWTSTERTGGRSRTMGAQVSPELEEA